MEPKEGKVEKARSSSGVGGLEADHGGQVTVGIWCPDLVTLLRRGQLERTGEVTATDLAQVQPTFHLAKYVEP